MLKRFIYITGFILVCSVITDSIYRGAYSSTSGAPGGVCGAPADGGATCKNCHTGPAAITQPGMITSNVPPTGYVPLTSYTISATVNRPGHLKFGFQISPQNTSGTLLGSLAPLDGSTQIMSVKYITHTTAGTSGSGTKTWSFNWTAPSAGTGAVTFYGAFNATNSNNQATGDSIFLSTLVINENNSASVPDYFHGTYVDVYPNPASQETFVSYTLKENNYIELKLFDLCGTFHKTILSEQQLAGRHTAVVSLDELTQGLYIISLEESGLRAIKKLLIIK